MGYGTDISDEEWAILASFLEPKPKGRPREHSLRRMVDAIRHVRRTGCQWRLLPKDFPPWRSVYVAFWRWRNSGLWEKILHELRKRVRIKAGRDPDPTLGIIDSQSVKTVQKGGSAAMTVARRRKGANAIWLWMSWGMSWLLPFIQRAFPRAAALISC